MLGRYHAQTLSSARGVVHYDLLRTLKPCRCICCAAKEARCDQRWRAPNDYRVIRGLTPTVIPLLTHTTPRPSSFRLVSVDKRQRKRLKQGAKAFEPWPNGSARKRTPQTSFGRTWRLVLFTRTCTRKHACLCQKHTKSTEHMTGATAWALRYDAVHFSAHCTATVFRFQDCRG